MRLDELENRILTWQEKLTELGISHWRIDGVEIKEDEGNNAGVEISAHYSSCSFYFTPEFLEDATDEEIDDVIVHEWVHVAMRDFDKSITSVEWELSPSTRRLWEDRIFHERESFVELISRQICIT